MFYVILEGCLAYGILIFWCYYSLFDYEYGRWILVKVIHVDVWFPVCSWNFCAISTTYMLVFY